MISLVEILTRTEVFLRERGIATPRLDAELLLCEVLGMKRLQIYLEHDRPITNAELEKIRPLVRRRGDREPLAWITGTVGFHAIDLTVRPGVLVPRPDTETLVTAALEWIDAEAAPVYLADVGCGSGAVGLALATALPGLRLYATDVGDAPLETTRDNVKRLGLESRVAVLRGSLLEPIPRQRPLDWVVSNPPYIPSADIAGLMPEVSKHEPRLALDGGEDGLDFYRQLIPAVVERGAKGLLVELGQGQAPRVADLFRKAGYTSITTWSDLGGIQRVVGGRVG